MPTAEEATTGAVTSSGNTTGDANDTSGGETDPGDPEWPAGFIVMDHEVPHAECDLWAQDCPLGEKCMPWARDGWSPDAYRCAPIVPDAARPGEPCTVKDRVFSGLDTCDGRSMCWDVDPKTLAGTCVAFCTGSEGAPVCAEPRSTCSINGDGVLILCLPTCDPLAQDCPAGEGCYGWADEFLCWYDLSGDAGGVGDPCEATNHCDPGLACVDPAVVPACTASSGCCAPFCDRAGPDACATGLACVPYFDPVEAPAGRADIGICRLPD